MLIVGEIMGSRMQCSALHDNKTACLSDQYANTCIWCEYDIGTTACYNISCVQDLPQPLSNLITYKATVGRSDPNSAASYWHWTTKMGSELMITGSIMYMIVLAAVIVWYAIHEAPIKTSVVVSMAVVAITILVQLKYDAISAFIENSIILKHLGWV